MRFCSWPALSTVIAVHALWPGSALGQSKEDLLSGAPLDPKVVVDTVGTAQVSHALLGCAAGKLSAGTANIDISVSPSGKATLTATTPALPQDVGACLAGVISSMSLPSSGTGASLTIAFEFPATTPKPGTAVAPKPDIMSSPEVQSAARIRRAGLGLLIPGLIVSALGVIGLGAVLAGDDGSTTGLGVSIGMISLGTALWIPGAVLVSLGSKRLAAALHMARLVPWPVLALTPGTRSGSLILGWWF